MWGWSGGGGVERILLEISLQFAPFFSLVFDENMAGGLPSGFSVKYGLRPSDWWSVRVIGSQNPL